MNSDLTLKISGMHCASCVSSIESILSAEEGIDSCSVNLAMNSASLTYDRGVIDEQQIIERIEQLGYGAVPGTPDILTSNEKEFSRARTNFRLSLLVTILLVIVSKWQLLTGDYLISTIINGLLQAAIAAVVLFYAGGGIYRDALLQARHGRANMNTLIAMGTLTGYVWSLYALTVIYRGGSEYLYFDSSAMIVALILLGRFLEARAKGKAGEAIKALARLAPPKATAIINKVEVEIDAGAVKPGMTLLVKPGERIPADGEITEGSPVIDESMLTGESIPVEKQPGDQAIGGALNGNLPFKMFVKASGEKSFLASIIRLVSDAQGKKAPVQTLADRVAAVFVPIVLGIAAVTFLAWYYFDPTSPMLIRSIISVLIIACPCSLGLATPTAILAGTGRAAREGIIVRGGDVLEGITRVDTVIFDKTGTLTYGQPEVVSVKTFESISERNLLRMAGSAEIQSEHPLARAIVNYMEAHQIERAVVKDVEALPGIGLKADCDGRRIIIGNKALMDKEKASFGQALMIADKEEEKGRTVVFVAVDGQVAGLIALADTVRADARDVVTDLKKGAKNTVMVSGDSRITSAGVAEAIGIEHCEAEVMPAQKKTIVDSFRKAGRNVAMIGDGINDAPALAAANVGVAIGSGTDIAMEAADVVLVRPDLTNVLKMFDVSTHTMRIIRQNLFWAFFYNVLAIPLAAGLLYPVTGWALSPMVAAAAMSVSSLFVVTNSLRLSRVVLNSSAAYRTAL